MPYVVILALLVVSLLAWRTWREGNIKNVAEEVTNITNVPDSTSDTSQEELPVGPEYYEFTSEKGVVIKLTNFEDKIIINNTNILYVGGQVPGSWLFEAEAPIAIVDKNGQEVLAGHISAEEWMTTDYVDFTTGTLDISSLDPNELDESSFVFKKANASGLPENDDRVTVPIEVR